MSKPLHMNIFLILIYAITFQCLKKTKKIFSLAHRSAFQNTFCRLSRKQSFLSKAGQQSTFICTIHLLFPKHYRFMEFVIEGLSSEPSCIWTSVMSNKLFLRQMFAVNLTQILPEINKPFESTKRKCTCQVAPLSHCLVSRKQCLLGYMLKKLMLLFLAFETEGKVLPTNFGTPCIY